MEDVLRELAEEKARRETIESELNLAKQKNPELLLGNNVLAASPLIETPIPTPSPFLIASK